MILLKRRVGSLFSLILQTGLLGMYVSLLYSGDMQNYLTTKLMPFVYFFLVFFALSVVWQIKSVIQGGKESIPAGRLLFAVPVLIVILAPTNTLSSSGLKKGAALLSATGTGVATENSSAPRTKKFSTIKIDEKNYFDRHNEFYDPGFVAANRGRRIEVSGLLFSDQELCYSDQGFIGRYSVACCIADAQPLVFGLLFEEDFSFDSEEEWIIVSGVVTEAEFPQGKFPAIKVESVRPNEQELFNPYVYPPGTELFGNLFQH